MTTTRAPKKRTAAAASAAAGPSITTAGKRKITAADKSPFTIDGVRYVLARPKSIVLGQAASLLDPARAWDDGENARVLLQYCARLIHYVEKTPRDADGELTGRDHLEARLADPDDSLDIQDLTPLFVEVMQGWFGDRPTGSPRASAPRRRA